MQMLGSLIPFGFGPENSQGGALHHVTVLSLGREEGLPSVFVLFPWLPLTIVYRVIQSKQRDNQTKELLKKLYLYLQTARIYKNSVYFYFISSYFLSKLLALKSLYLCKYIHCISSVRFLFMLFPIHCTWRHTYSNVVFNLELSSPLDFTIFFSWPSPSSHVCRLFAIPCFLYVTPRSLSPRVNIWPYFPLLQPTWKNHMDFLFLSFSNFFFEKSH